MTLVLSCAMNFKRYPHDEQTCNLKIESSKSKYIIYISLDGYLSICLTGYLSISLTGYLSISLTGYLSISLTGYLSISLTGYLSIY